jgi:hypothetical protein
MLVPTRAEPAFRSGGQCGLKVLAPSAPRAAARSPSAASCAANRLKRAGHRGHRRDLQSGIAEIDRFATDFNALLYRDCNGFKPIDDPRGRDPGNAIICPRALRLRLRLLLRLAAGDALARWISADDLPRLETCTCLRA